MMTSRKLRFFIPMLIPVLCLAACGHDKAPRQSHAGLQPEPPLSLDDVATTLSVKMALAIEPGVSSKDLSVKADHGFVTLMGEVRSEAERQLAAKIAEDVRGVKQVRNEIRVRG